MLRNVILIGLVSLALPAAAIAYPAPRAEALPQKAHGCLGLNLQLITGDRFRVFSISDNGPACRAGLRPHDIIIEIDNRPVEATEKTLDRIASCRPGSRVPIRIERGGRFLTLIVEVGLRDENTSNGQCDWIVDPRFTINGEENERQTGVVEGVGEEFILDTDW